MSSITLETAIKSFLALGERLQAATSLTGRRVLEELAAWYHETRVEGATLEEDGDMLLLQWGATRMLLVEAPTDLRLPGDEDLLFGDPEVKYLDFTRQVCVTADMDDAEFDDVAVQMSVTLGFEPAKGTEQNSNQWITSPDVLERGKHQFLANDFVQSLIDVPAHRIAITAGHCG